MGAAGTDDASFSHVDLPVALLDEVAYRSGDDKANEPRKQPGGSRQLLPPRPPAGG